MATAPTAEPPRVLVDVTADREPVGEVLGAVDSALACDENGLVVRVIVAGGNPGQESIAALCASDPRVIVTTPESESPKSALHVQMPATARLTVRSIPAMRKQLEDSGAGSLRVSVPGRFGLLEKLRIGRFVAATSVQASAADAWGDEHRIGASAAEVQSSVWRRPPEAPPKADLHRERSEHLRHRARSASYRARLDRNTQRLARERLQSRHESGRARLADRRLAARSPLSWISWRSRQLASLAAAVPRVAWTGFKTVRQQVRRAKRLLIDRRRAPAE